MAKKKVILEEVEVVIDDVTTEEVVDNSAEILAEIVRQQESQPGHSSRDLKS